MTLYGWHLPSQRTNCVTWLLRRLAQGEDVKIVNDIFNNHLWVGDASRALIAAIEKECCGLFHLGGPTTLSRYELSLKVADIFGFDRGRILPVPSDHFPSLAPRPRDTSCTTRKMVDMLGIIPVDPDQGIEGMRSTRPPWAEEHPRANGQELFATEHPKTAFGSKGR
jgi:dTDP-4-dehydrorhamnose reductase